MPVERQILEWNRPFSEVLGDWLWKRRERLPEMLVIVPTAQSGRRLREGIAERGGALAPRVQTPGSLMQHQDRVPEVVEILAWVETLERIKDWSKYSGAFPNPPSREESGWSIGLAKTLTDARSVLQASGLTMFDAAKRMSETVDRERWDALACLEEEMDAMVAGWGRKSQVQLVKRGSYDWDDSIREVVVAGVPDLSPAVTRMLKHFPFKVQVLIAGEKEEDFDEWGRPLEHWAERHIDWPSEGSVTLSSDARDQAEKALASVSSGGRSSSNVALGSVDEGVSRELVRVFGREGWPVHDPGCRKVPVLAGWLAAWRKYARRPEIAEAIDLLAFAGTGALVRGKRAQRTVALSRLRDKNLVRSKEDLERLKLLFEEELDALEPAKKNKEESVKRSIRDVQLSIETIEHLDQSMARFKHDGFHQGIRNLLPYIDDKDEANVTEWLDQMDDIVPQVDRSHAFWLELLQVGLRPVTASSVENRVLDVQGWLELFHESGEHLVICGMNEGKVPASMVNNPWLTEATRRRIGLSSQESLGSRDAYLLTAMLKAREQNGRVDLLLGKSSDAGDALLPSRLLLSASGPELAHRVKDLFRKGLDTVEEAFTGDDENEWKQLGGGWQLPEAGTPTSIGVTAFTDYLACPSRYYLSHVLGMKTPDPERVEWNSRDYGNVAHYVLEQFGRNEQVRNYSCAQDIEDWLHEALLRLVKERFGNQPAAAIRIQSKSMMERLSWFAEEQARLYSEGWRIEQVEEDFEIDIDGVTIRGIIDRVDRHAETGVLRVLDYKTKAKAIKVISAHAVGITAKTVFPEHLENVDEVRAELPVGRKNKVVPARWINLQLPLYAMGLANKSKKVDELGYFSLGASRSSVLVSLWPDFAADDQEAALRCAKWVVKQIKQQRFSPRSDKVKYDSYEGLKTGKVIDLMEF